MSKPEEVAVSRLVLHEENPRFRRPMAQDEAIAHFSKDPKTRKLAKDIVSHGVNPLELIAVNRIAGGQKLLVREGNRRAAALKLLLDPAKASDPASEAYFSKIVREGKLPVPRKAWVVVVPEEAELRHWIRLKHVPNADGVSTLFWDTWEMANFDGGTSSTHRHAHELVQAGLSRGWLATDAPDRINLSTMNRVLEDKAARAALGFQVDQNGLHTVLSVEDQQNVIAQLASDTGKGGTQTSRTLQKSADIKKYATGVAKALKLKVNQQAVATRVGSAPGSTAAAKKARVSSPRPADDLKRIHVIPRGYHANVTNQRAADIMKELKTLRIDKTPNAPAVLLRIFLEFSVIHYAEKNGVDMMRKLRNGDEVRDELRTIIIRVRENLLANNRIKRGDLAAINRSLNDDDHFLSVAQLNQYVHNPRINPTQRELNSAWVGIAPFITVLWEQ